MQKEAWQEYELMEEKYTIYHPYTKLEKARLLYSEKEEVKQEEGGTIFRQLAEKYPFQSMFGLSSCVVVNEIFEYEMPGLNFQLR